MTKYLNLFQKNLKKEAYFTALLSKESKTKFLNFLISYYLFCTEIYYFRDITEIKRLRYLRNMRKKVGISAYDDAKNLSFCFRNFLFHSFQKRSEKISRKFLKFLTVMEKRRIVIRRWKRYGEMCR